MMATPSAKPCSFKASCRSFRRNRTASRPRNATSAPTRTATASSACSTGSSSSVASPPATTRPQSLSSASYAWLRCGSGCRLLSTGPNVLMPPKTVMDNGYMAQDCWRKDPVHGNVKYGNAIIHMVLNRAFGHAGVNKHD